MNEFIEQDVTKDAEGQSRLNDGLGVWMPIETAPKQGRILVWNAYFGVYSSEFTSSLECIGLVFYNILI